MIELALVISSPTSHPASYLLSFTSSHLSFISPVLDTGLRRIGVSFTDGSRHRTNLGARNFQRISHIRLIRLCLLAPQKYIPPTFVVSTTSVRRPTSAERRVFECVRASRNFDINHHASAWKERRFCSRRAG